MAILGIDLGTTNSLACIWDNHKYVLIPNAFGAFLTPSVVSFLENGEILVGEAAKQRLITHPSTTFAEFKRYMGTDKTYMAYGKAYQPQDLSALVIRKLVEDASVFLHEDIEEAIISVPAYFNDDQRWATKIAGQLAGIRVERIINEPSAAALSHHMVNLEEDMLALVVDFGGGTLDISIVEAFDNVVEIRAISGDNHLGGSDFDEAILESFLQEQGMKKQELQAQELGLLKNEVEKVKKQLSVRTDCTLQVMLHGQKCEMKWNRGKLTSVCMPLLQRIRIPMERVLKDSGLHLQDIQEIILVGGTCRMPVVIQFLEYLLQRNVTLSHEPDQAIAIGCGVAGGIKERNRDVRDLLLSDICPFTLGIAVYDDATESYALAPIIERNSTLPCSVLRLFTYRSKNGKLEIRVLQGDHRQAEANLLVRTVEIKVPKTKEEYQPISVRFTYDINGLLEVETNTYETKSEQRIVIQNKMNRMKEEEVKLRLKELQEFKLPSHEKEVFRNLLERGERLFYESVGERRRNISDLLDEFEQALQRENMHQIHESYKKVKAAFDELEKDTPIFFS
ncbi:molecular chaperone HscC [Erysipelotrichaceae bacterium AF15-26LB]|nr:Hsp70 family protein [[Clostridium] innocuum]RJV88757.1 molecular chaperone HscC [Erysipelotrichaceae bacterium AF19-24AC]RJV92860.1 molecular chaperone HscC [Erysipelotrichaceae bacterium AF15-26LB]